MKIKTKNIIPFIIGLALATALLFSSVACSKTSSPTTTSTKTVTSSATSPTTTPSRTFSFGTNPFTASPTTYHIGLYSDAECTNSISSLNWGNLPQGTSATQTVFLENLDNQTMTITASISPSISGITFTNSGPINMIPGSLKPSIYQLQITLSASSGAKLGVLNFNIGLTGATPISIAGQVNIVSTSTGYSTSTPAAILSSITVAPSNPSILSVDSTQQFTAIGAYSDGATANITSQVTWASSNISKATISSMGLATGEAAGNTNITAALSGVTSPAVALTVAVPVITTTP